MTLQNLIQMLVMVEKTSTKGMAVPKKRRSKAKGKTRLSNWKKKSATAAQKAYNEAKTFFAKEKLSVKTLEE